jgi:hypothetical protein
LCGRNQPVEVAELVRIVAAVAEVLPWPLHLLGRLASVICHFDQTRNATFAPCQRLLRCDGAKKQGGVLGDKPVPARAALR